MPSSDLEMVIQRIQKTVNSRRAAAVPAGELRQRVVARKDYFQAAN
jgi:hypothetical protein